MVLNDEVAGMILWFLLPLWLLANASAGAREGEILMACALGMTSVRKLHRVERRVLPQFLAIPVVLLRDWPYARVGVPLW